MVNILLFDSPASRLSLYPLSLTRPVCDIRTGILTIREWWSLTSGQAVYAVTEEYLQEAIPDAESYILVDASVIPDENCMQQVLNLKKGEVLEDENGLIAYWSEVGRYNEIPVWPDRTITIANQQRLGHVSDIYKFNSGFIKTHFKLLTDQKKTENIHSYNLIFNEKEIFIEEGASVMGSIINATEGPIYIGRNVMVMEGTLIRGPVAICEGATVKMGTKLYPGTTIGPYSTVGGEIKNTVIMGYSNKAHDGYLGDSVLGEWCNLGAGTSNSNVKNTAGEVSLWHEENKSFKPVGLKAGLIMGDYSRCAINTSFNTGTTIGVSCNIFEGNFPPKHLPSFSWGFYERYLFEKVCRDASNWKKMKGKEFTHQDRLILQHIFERAK